MIKVLQIIGSAIILTAVIFLVSLIHLGETTFGPLENTDGIPYPRQAENNDAVLVTESLAHTDVFINSPVLAQEIRLQITYEPVNISSLAVGIREDSFWLSYGSRQTLPVKNSSTAMEIIRIPLTDKLQEPNHSLDLMFFAETADGQQPLWALHGIRAGVIYTQPTYAEFKDYVRSILKRERAL